MTSFKGKKLPPGFWKVRTACGLRIAECGMKLENEANELVAITVTSINTARQRCG